MPVHGTGCNEHFQDQQWYGPPRNQHGSHNFYSEGCYESNYFDDDPSYGNFFSSSTPSNVSKDCRYTYTFLLQLIK